MDLWVGPHPVVPPPDSMFTQCSCNQCPSVIALAALLHLGSTLSGSNSKDLHLIKFGLERDLERAHLFSHLMLLTQEPSQAHSGRLICLAISCCLLESLLELTRDICLYEGKVMNVRERTRVGPTRLISRATILSLHPH